MIRSKSFLRSLGAGVSLLVMLSSGPAWAYLGGTLAASIAFTKHIDGLQPGTAVFFVSGRTGRIAHENWSVAPGKFPLKALSRVIAANAGHRKLVCIERDPPDLLGAQIVYRYDDGARITVVARHGYVVSVDAAVRDPWKFSRSYDIHGHRLFFGL